jgi:mRNA-degrading endonuclease RelE of RelBE toxin-antitoxin system
MKVDIYTHPEFEPEFKRLCKKYHSLIDDYAQLLDDLEKSPFQGTSLGMGTRKVRMGVDSKGGGKSGGMRVITYSVIHRAPDVVELTLLYIYDKSEKDSINTRFIKYLLANK